MIGATPYVNRYIANKNVTPVEQEKHGDISEVKVSTYPDSSKNPSSENHDLPYASEKVEDHIFIAQPSKREVALKQIVVDDSVIAKRNLEIRELDRVVNSTVYAKNLAYAEIICKNVREFVPLGTNTEADSHKHAISFKDKVKMIQRLRCGVSAWVNNYRTHHQGSAPTNDKIYAECTVALKKYRYGHCGELAKAAFVEAQKNPDISAVHYCSSTEGKHALIIIGEIEKDGWSKDAVVCDPWAEKCYCSGQEISDTSISFFAAIFCSKTEGGRLPNAECTRSQL